MITLLSSMRLSLISIQQCCLPLSVQLTIAIRYMHLQLSENLILTCIYSQATKQIFKLNGVEIYVGLFSMTNERGELRICDLVATKAHSQIEQHLMQLNRSLSLYGHSQPQIIFTDNMADKPLLQTCFPELTKDVIPVEKYSHLPPMCLPHDCHVFEYDTASGIDQAIWSIMDNVDEDTAITVGFDTEWNVNVTNHGHTQRRDITAVIQIAWKNHVYLFQVSYTPSNTCY